MEGTVHCKHAAIIHEPRLCVGGVILWQTALNHADYTADPELNISTTPWWSWPLRLCFVLRPHWPNSFQHLWQAAMPGRNMEAFPPKKPCSSIQHSRAFMQFLRTLNCHHNKPYSFIPIPVSLLTRWVHFGTDGFHCNLSMKLCSQDFQLAFWLSIAWLVHWIGKLTYWFFKQKSEKPPTSLLDYLEGKARLPAESVAGKE